MKIQKSYYRGSISLAVAMAVMMVFTLRSFAAPELKPLVDPTPAQDCTGTLSVKSGTININGNVAQTGATVMSGSTIATSSGGGATIDMGALGRVELGDSTTVTITCAGGSLQIRSSCSRTEVEVRTGTLNVTAPSAATLAAGQEAKYDGGIEASSTGAIDVKVECEGRRGGAGGGPFVGAGLIGLLALIGIGAGVAIGVAVGDNDGVIASSPVL